MAKTEKAEKATPETAQADAETPAQDETPGWAHSDTGNESASTHMSIHEPYALADDDLTKDLPVCFWEAVGMHSYSQHPIQMARLISVAYENGFLGEGPFSLNPTDEGRKRFKALAEALQTTESGLSLITQIAEDKWGTMERKMAISLEVAAEADLIRKGSPGIAATKEETATVEKEGTDTDK